MATVKIWLRQIRAPFLVVTLVSVFLGASVAVYQGHPINALYLGLAFLGALLAHVSVNVLNEYFDYRSGVDFKTVKTPFSGGSGVLIEGLLNPRTVYAVGLLCIAGILAIGGYFIYVYWDYGLVLIPLGVVGLATIYFYTTHITRSPLACVVAPGLGFGPIMVLGTYFALTGGYSLAAGLASLVPFFLVSNLLLLNQFPDVEADRSVARHHLPIAIGRKASADVYSLLLLAAYVALIVSVSLKVLPYMALIGLLTAPLAVMAAAGARRYHDQMENLVPVMARNVLLTLLFPLLVSVGIIVSRA